MNVRFFLHFLFLSLSPCNITEKFIILKNKKQFPVNKIWLFQKRNFIFRIVFFFGEIPFKYDMLEFFFSHCLFVSYFFLFSLFFLGKKKLYFKKFDDNNNHDDHDVKDKTKQNKKNYIK